MLRRSGIDNDLDALGFNQENHMIEYVCGFYRDEQNNLLLILKNKPDWQKGKFNGVGGKIEPKESVILAMAREFQEETGFTTNAEEWKLKLVLEAPNYKVYFMTYDGVWFIPTPSNEGELQWHKDMTLPLNVLPNLKWIIPMCFDRTIVFPVFIGDSR